MKTKKEYTRDRFREELQKRMPGYEWTVRRPDGHDKKHPETDTWEAEGMRASGFNRLTTLIVNRYPNGTFAARIWNGMPKHWLYIAGVGLRPDGKSLDHHRGYDTLAQALRALQEHCERQRNHYGAAASYMEEARKGKRKPSGGIFIPGGVSAETDKELRELGYTEPACSLCSDLGILGPCSLHALVEERTAETEKLLNAGGYTPS